MVGVMARMAGGSPEIFVNERGPYLGTLSVETEQIDVTMAGNSYKPDPQWTHVDKAGHFHAFTGDGLLPTLETFRKHIGCDGTWHCDPDGHCETRYRCRICRKRVKPGYAVDQIGGEKRTMPGRTSWTVTVGPTRKAWTADVSVRVVHQGGTLFGIATPVLAGYATDGNTWEFHGVTELGRRP